MSEETEVKDHNDGSWSGLKKTIIGGLTTLITAGGVWVSTHLFGGESKDEEKAKTETAAPAAAPIVVNVANNNTNQQKQGGGGTTTIIKEKTVEKATPAAAPAKPKEEDPW
jgi:flagellar basal body-associated protein FliL